MKENKWQRITYMPCSGLGEKGERVTASPSHIALSRRAAREGAVLLKNEESVLPLKKGQKIAILGKAQADYVKGGGGSGDVGSPYIRSILEGLRMKESEGKVNIFAPLSLMYEAYVKEKYEEGIAPGMMPEPEIPEKLLQDAAAFADTAVICICRFSAEGYDRTGKPFDGDFYLSREETEMIRKAAVFQKIVVVLNTGGMMETRWIRENKAVKGALLAGQGGMEGGLAVSDILCGDVCPCGHLADTYAESFDAYPSAAHFHDSESYAEYTEDIYVGYRFFETIPGADEKVVYPFGWGLSYTGFAIWDVQVKEEDVLVFTCKVKNTGSFEGKEVVQLYCKAPSGKLGKSSRVLVGFAKTKLLAPGAEETVTISVSPYAFASYDDKGLVQKSAYVLEKGCYDFFMGENVRDAERLEYSYELSEDKILMQLREKCAPKQLHQRMLQDGSFEEVNTKAFTREKDDASKIPFDGQPPEERTWVWRGSLWTEPLDPQLMDVFEKKITLDDFESCLSDEMKIHLLGGQPGRGCCNTMGFGNIPRFGIVNAMTADGPAGLRFLEKTGVQTTAFPVASLLAQTWDEKLLQEIGKCAAEEIHENGVGIWLAPAINIHRNPLCGRNFEYYSEDPFLTGKLAASLIRGVQSLGVAACVKHFACNNKETNRRESDSRVSERALREIYLKAFEICVKEADPWVLMSSYNLLNGERTSENRELLTDILRTEWGFDGVVTTDWYTNGEQYREINAGNDIKMACGTPEYTLEALSDGRLSRKALDESVKRVLRLLLKLA